MLVMRSILARPPVPVVLALSLSGCRAVGGIFKAGVWVGIFVAIGLVALFALILSFRRGPSGPSVR